MEDQAISPVRGEHPPGNFFEGLDPKDIGLRIRLVRRELGRLTQSELGEICGTTSASVANWERGANLITLYNGAAICREFGLTLDWLILGSTDSLRVETARLIFEAEARIQAKRSDSD
jgi:transcriptional regulator with XRE-family HTH domain